MNPAISHSTPHAGGTSPFAAARSSEAGAKPHAQGERAAEKPGSAVVVEFGAEAKALADQSAQGAPANASEKGAPFPGAKPVAAEEKGPFPGAKVSAADEAPAGAKGGSELTEEEQQQVQEMKARDREVRVHEQAHKAAGGGYTGAIQLHLERGPDGGNYAVSGHVDIDVSPVKGDPAATIRKMAIVARSASAPAQPSSADRAVAAQAAATASQARVELAVQSRKSSDESGVSGVSAGASLREAHGVGHAADVSEAQHAALVEAHQRAGRRPLNLVA